MDSVLQKIHLASGLGLLVFMLMYFTSGFVIYNNSLFPNKPAERDTRSVELNIPDGLDDSGTAHWLASELDLSGKLDPPRPLDDGRTRIAWSVPGRTNIVYLAADKQSAEIVIGRTGLKGHAVDYHFVHGYGDGWLWNLWVLMLDLSSAGIIVFAISGIGIWASARERDKGSWAMLAGGTVLTVGMVLYYMIL